jgi:two-component system NtrC family sensor kinase
MSRPELNALSTAADAGRAPLDRFVQGASFAMLVLGADRNVQLANERACSLLLATGITAPVGHPLASVVRPELRSPIEGIVSAVLREHRMVEADRLTAASDRVLDVVGYPVDDAGVARHVVVVANDVTERAALESQLVQSSKLATIGELAAGVAHEINNPLSFVMSNLKTLQRYWEKIAELLIMADDLHALVRNHGNPVLVAAVDRFEAERDRRKIRGVLAEIAPATNDALDGTTRILKIVQDLKSFARPDDAQFRPENVNQIVERSLRLVANEIKYIADVALELEEVPPVWCNGSQLSQVFVNLLINAAQAIEERGRIVVRTHRNGDEVLVEIEDNGCGISEDVLPRIFDPFFTTKPPGRGTGLGLSVSYGIVERHGGRIRVESVPGKGSKFTVILPVAEARPGEEAE